MHPVRILAGLMILSVLLSDPAGALEYQWKFFLPTLDDRTSAVKAFEILNDIHGVYDVDVNMEQHWVMFFFDDEFTDESAVKRTLQKKGFPVDKMMLLLEPREGVMN